MSDGLAIQLKNAAERLDSGAAADLDFSAVPRLDPAAVHALAALGAKARERSVALRIHGAAIDTYRVLKLMKIESQFRFV